MKKGSLKIAWIPLTERRDCETGVHYDKGIAAEWLAGLIENGKVIDSWPECDGCKQEKLRDIKFGNEE